MKRPATARHGQPLFDCPLLRWPTAEESAEFEREAEAGIDRIMRVLPELERVRREHKGKDWAGEIPCPACETTLHLTHAAINGHVHGRCETAGCVSFME